MKISQLTLKQAPSSFGMIHQLHLGMNSFCSRHGQPFNCKILLCLSCPGLIYPHWSYYSGCKYCMCRQYCLYFYSCRHAYASLVLCFSASLIMYWLLISLKSHLNQRKQSQKRGCSFIHWIVDMSWFSSINSTA